MSETESSGGTKYTVGVYTHQEVGVTAESEQEARDRALKKADPKDGEPFTEKPREVRE